MPKIELTEVLAIQYRGNYADDAGAFNRVAQFCAQPEVSGDDRFAALLDSSIRGMGETFERTPAAIEYCGDPKNFHSPIA